jgi:hypothetical protein
MTEKKYPEIIEEQIFDFFVAADSATIREIAEDLGYDHNLNAPKRERLLKFFKFQESALEREESNNNLTMRAKDFVNRIVQDFVGKPTNQLKELLLSKGIQVQYRNLDSLTEESIRDILSDVELLNALEKFDKEEDCK